MSLVCQSCSNIAAVFLLALSPLGAEQGKLTLHIADAQDKSIAGLSVSVVNAGTQTTDTFGTAVVQLASGTHPTDWVTVLLYPQTRMVFISPWDGRVMVPSFDPGKENFARVVLASPGDRELLRKSAAVAAFASRCIAGNKPQSLSSKKSGEKRRVLEEVAKFYDLPPDDIDKAILDWSSKSQDPYERGVFQLYEGNLAAARKELDAASHAKDLKPDAEARIAVTLGQALYAQENWKESANAYLLAFKLRPDASILEACVLSLIKANRCSEAEPLLQQALTPRVAPTPAPK